VVLADRLQELLRLAQATQQLQRAFLFGSFVTDAAFPGDLDVFLLMQEGFDRGFRSLPPPQREVFDYEQARLMFEADVFWATEVIGAEELMAWVSVYQLSREMVPRGIVEVLLHD
jgi:hypothetical protein